VYKWVLAIKFRGPDKPALDYYIIIIIIKPKAERYLTHSLILNKQRKEGNNSELQIRKQTKLNKNVTHRDLSQQPSLVSFASQAKTYPFEQRTLISPLLVHKLDNINCYNYILPNFYNYYCNRMIFVWL